MVLQCKHIEKSFGENGILTNCSFHIEDQDKAAIVGINGSGKSTLMKIIVGEILADKGSISLTKNMTMGYLAQHQSVDKGETIFEELLSVKEHILHMEKQMRVMEKQMKSIHGQALDKLMAQYSALSEQFEQENGFALKSEATGVLKGLGFSEGDFSKKITTLSGGEKTRIALGKLLLSKPDFLLLDEPTNHLDMDSISWLETYLSSYEGAILLVAHDRYFLDKVVHKIIEIEQGKVLVFDGNYTDYTKKKEGLRLSALHAYENQQQEIKRQKEIISKLKSFNREKSVKRAESREKLLDKMHLLEKPKELTDKMNLRLNPLKTSGNDVLTITNLCKSFDSRILFHHVDLSLYRGEHVAIIGSNGAGKTTLLKIIGGLLSQDEGKVVIGSNVHIGYYDQEHQVLKENHSLFEEISYSYPSLTNTEIRNTLAAFLFTGEDVFKQVKDLSGGEKGRLSFAKLMLGQANFLLLDEPTNHLDMVSKELLEKALNLYKGTILYVSHDRYFINKTAHRVLDLQDQALTNYLGNYDAYIEKQEGRKEQLSIPSEPSRQSSSPKTNALLWKEKKEQEAKKRKRENDLRRTEEEITVLEEKNAALEEEMALPEVATHAQKLQELTKEMEEIKERLTVLYEQWEGLVT